MPDKTILIMAGGTGGHVYPALAVADNLKQRGYSLFWLGTNKGLESSVVPDNGYPLLTINVAGVRGKGVLRIIVTPFMLVLAIMQALMIMNRIRPAAVLGMGGFASGPGGIAAWLMRIPLLIHEQNAIAGLTNRLSAPFAVKIMAAFPTAFEASSKLHITGNPVREEISALMEPESRFAGRNPETLKVLILGGSLGAKKLNEVIPETLSSLKPEGQLQIKHQCGTRHVNATESEYEKYDLDVEVLPFIKDMAATYAWADIVICRAGALTVAELAVCGVASILVPFPYAVDDHQTENAKYLSDDGAAILIQETDLNVSSLKEILLKLWKAPEELLSMAVKARSLGKSDATETVTNLCVEVASV